METGISEEDVVGYLDDDVVEEVESVSDPELDFNIGVRVGGMGVHVVRERSDGPVVVVGVMALEGDHLDTFEEMSEAQRMNYLSQIGAVLTNSPGLYRFTDGKGNDVDYADLRAVRVEHRIYPDGFGQDALMNSVFDVVQALYYVKTMTNVFMSNVESRR